MAMLTHEFEPDFDCDLCPRLVEYRNHYRKEAPDWHNAPVPSWSAPDPAVKLLIIGLAPGLKGANRTGRPFTGDFAGDLLYQTLCKFGFAQGKYGLAPDDGLQLVDCAITNAVRCVPPQNKPIGAEVNNCRPFLINTLKRFPNLQILLTLGKIAHDTTARTLGVRVASVPFAHNNTHSMADFTVVSSYHCSRYNTNTGRLTEAMFESVFETIRARLDNPTP